MTFPGVNGPQLLARLNQDGSLDPAFPVDQVGQGKLTAWEDRVYVGRTQIVSRITHEGQLDPTWAEMNTTPYFLSLQGGDYHVYPDGRLLMSGVHQVEYPDSNWVGFYNLIWFTADGYLDTTRAPRMGDGVIYEIEPMSDGSFMCTGPMTVYEGEAVPTIFRVDAAGRYDPSFQPAMTWGEVYTFTELEDGRILASGFFRTSINTIDTTQFVRFMPNGALDPTFNNDLVVYSNEYHRFVSPRHKRLPDGRILLLGDYDSVDGQPRSGIALLSADGELLNTAFANGGCGLYQYQGLSYNGTLGATLSGDSLIYIHGAYHGYTDGTTSDPQQRFVTRLYGPDIGMGTNQPAWELAPTATLRLAPNPSTNWMSIDHVLPGTDEEGRLVVRDIMGRVVYTTLLTTHAGQHVWDTRRTTAGTYSVELLDASGGTVLVERAVVQP